MQSDIHIAVVSDDPLLRDGLVAFLAEQSDFTLTTCDADAGWLALSRVRDHDIILVDARMETASPPGAAIPDGAVVIFVGAPEDDGWAGRALAAGARGILTPAAGYEDVVKAIRVVASGSIWARRRWLNACVLDVVGASRRLAARDVVITRLSRREREVLSYAATGVGNKELADRLAISEATVKVHLTRIFQKLGVSGRAQLAAAFHQFGDRGLPRMLPDDR